MFRAIANIELDEHFEPGNVGQVLQEMDMDAALSPKFDRLSMAYDDNPNLLDVTQNDRCAKKVTAAYTEYDPVRYDNWDVMSICGVVFETYYTLHDLEHPPVWALDGNGHPEAGFSCDGLTDHDSAYMMSPGAVLLHELLHWPYLFEDVPGYSTLVDRTPHSGLKPVVSDLGYGRDLLFHKLPANDETYSD